MPQSPFPWGRTVQNPIDPRKIYRNLPLPNPKFSLICPLAMQTFAHGGSFEHGCEFLRQSSYQGCPSTEMTFSLQRPPKLRRSPYTSPDHAKPSLSQDL